MKRLVRNLILFICFLVPFCASAQQEHFKLLGRWCMEGEQYGCTPFCFEITMDKFGIMNAKVPASYSMWDEEVTQWQNTRVHHNSDNSGYNFEGANSRRPHLYGINIRKTNGSNEYQAILILIDENVGANSLTASVDYIYGTFEDQVGEMGKRTFRKVGEVEKPNLVDDKQTRKKGDKGKVAQAVDLGLSVKWASWNVGASKPEDYGAYYAWGETKEKDTYDWSTYLYINRDVEEDYWDGDSIVYKYQRIGKTVNSDKRYAEISICGTKFDVARTEWGGKWRMPTNEEVTELLKCDKQRSELNGVEGWYFTGPNGNKIFLPSAGYKDEYGTSYNMKDWRGTGCMYWSGDLLTYGYLLGVQYQELDGSSAVTINFDERGVEFGNHFARCLGLSVRPVSE